MVTHLCGCYRVSERRACRVTGWAQSTQRYRSVKDPRTALRVRMREIAQARIRYGSRFSRTFSSCNCFSCRTWSTSKPVYCFFQR